MNKTIEDILSRRSCKSYESLPIEHESIELIVKTAQFAPSAMNSQGWHFLAITNSQVLKQLNSIVFETLPPETVQRIRSRCEGEPSLFYNAPVFIVVSCSSASPYPEADCATAIQNMQLAAHSLGLGACWINQLTRTNNKVLIEFLTELGMPQGNIIYGCCCVGHIKKAGQDKPRAKDTVTFVD